MFRKQTIKDLAVRGQTVLVRVDYNVPMKNGKIIDDLRIRASLPTLELLRKKGARRIIVISHLGRPKGQKIPELSLLPAAKRLEELMPGGKVFFATDVSGPDVEEMVERLPVGGILVLENLRFFPGEEENSAEFAKEIVDATHADVFVQDGFAVVHRAHASTAAITAELPSVAGLLLEKEVLALQKLTENPTHPFVVVIGGAKVEDKQPLIDKFSKIADKIIVGGKIAGDGYQSKLPNVYIAEDFIEGTTENVPAEKTELVNGKLDMGPIALGKTVDAIKNAKTVLWNGLLGVAEIPAFAGASTELAIRIGEARSLNSIICGGDTTGFVENLMREHNAAHADEPDAELRYTLLSTGGGAALELLAGAEMPGIESLDD